MNYLNLTSIELKRALVVKSGRNWERSFSCSEANRLLIRGGVEETRLEAKAKDTKKIRGQG